MAVEAALPGEAQVLVAGHTELADGSPVRVAGGSSEAGAEAGR